MKITMLSSLSTFIKKIDIIFLLFATFFLIAFGSGYPTLKYYSPYKTPYLDDSAVYANHVVSDSVNLTTDHRSTRLLVPLLARSIYFLFENKIGSWDPIQFSLLLIVSIFCALICILMIKIAQELFLSRLIGVIAGFVFISNFTVQNLYLAGLTDSAESFFLLLMLYAIMKRKWAFIPLIAFFGTLSKETFLVNGVSLSLAWHLFEFLKEKKRLTDDFIWIILFGFVSASTIMTLKYVAFGSIILPWNVSEYVIVNEFNFTLHRFLIELLHFSYAYIWLLPFALFRLHKLPSKIVASLVITVIPLFVLGWWVGVSGAALSRYFFNVLGPMLSIAAAMSIYDMSLGKDKP